LVQGVAEPQLPVASHVCVAALPEHCVAPGVQTPEQTPLTHAWLLQVAGEPHMPLGPHVWTAVTVEHSVAPGVHDPTHAPPMHA